ncbi:MAG: adenine methyltransferase [Rhodospirillales bacterium]|nr:adenine methyltransferase [Rhodospirillales bacterium]
MRSLLSLPAAGKYRVVVGDPPWPYDLWSKRGAGRSALRHYPTMTLTEICSLPVAQIAARDAVLFLWVTQPDMLRRAQMVLDAWGFNYKSIGFVWVKAASSGEDGRSIRLRMNQGKHTRAGAELCLLATRGNGYRRADKGVPQVVVAPQREHSRKPDEVFACIERLTGGGPGVELFARARRPGWDVWGNEVGVFEPPDVAATAEVAI